MLDNYKKAFSRLAERVPVIANEYNTSRAFIYADALWNFIRYGVTPNEYLGWQFYAKSALEKRTFYSARRKPRTEKKLNAAKFYDTFWKKEIFNSIFSEFIERDWLYVPDATDEEIAKFLNDHTKVIVKPTDLSSGKGIHIYNNEGYDLMRNNKVLLEDCIIQAKEMSSLNPTSVNTIRVYTILDKWGGVHILSASVRVGGIGSTTDNFHSGGVGYPIDIQYGIVKAAGADMMGERHIIHPGTEIIVVGFKIPRWNSLIEFVNRAAQKIPDARMIAWDVAITENGFDMVEGNYDGDPGVMQTPQMKGKWLEIKKFM